VFIFIYNIYFLNLCTSVIIQNNILGDLSMIQFHLKENSQLLSKFIYDIQIYITSQILEYIA
jgi:hypothetical protein